MITLRRKSIQFNDNRQRNRNRTTNSTTMATNRTTMKTNSTTMATNSTTMKTNSATLVRIEFCKLQQTPRIVRNLTTLHQRQATSTWWCGPLPCIGEGRNGLSIPRGFHPRAFLPWTTLLIFYPRCPMRGHIWTALLNPIDRTPISSTFFLTTSSNPFFHPKLLLYLSHSPLSLILMLLLISGDIHPNPGPIDPCSVCSRRVTWGKRSVQCPTVLWVHLSWSGLSPADFRKISPGHSWTCPMCPFSSQLSPSLLHPNPAPKSPTSTHKHHKNIFLYPPPKQRINPPNTPN